jgi:peptidoglycan/xylan/chitin deacetylase (PgdA/CDA1 family)
MREPALPILMYHGLHAGPRDRGVVDPVYSVNPAEFARQLDWLAANGYRTLRLRDAARAVDERAVVITFDDGDVSNFEVALPLLRARGMCAEFFITTAFIGRAGYLDEADLCALAAAGMGIESHGATHRHLDDLAPSEAAAELAASKRHLERLVGVPVRALALPGGRGGERELEMALQIGYVDVLNSEPGVNRQRTPGAYLQRLAVTRTLDLRGFAALVQWRGAGPRLQRARYDALRRVKRLLGNRRYETLRARLLTR